MAEVKGAALLYGSAPRGDVANIKAAVYGVDSDDPNDVANERRDTLAQALEAAGVTHQIAVYAGTQHAFNSDTGPRSNEAQALAAWRDTIAWFARYIQRSERPRLLTGQRRATGVGTLVAATVRWAS